MVQVEQAQQHVSVQQNVSVPPAAIRLLSLAARFATERTPFEVKRRLLRLLQADGTTNVAVTNQLLTGRLQPPTTGTW